MTRQTRHRLTESGADQSVPVSAGDEIEIELTELATSGYQWAVEAAPPGAVVTFERPSMDASAAPGAAAKTIARVRIDSPAAGTLVLAHRQPWSPDAPSNRLRLHLVRRG